jgi:hypothetical protein
VEVVRHSQRELELHQRPTDPGEECFLEKGRVILENTST